MKEKIEFKEVISTSFFIISILIWEWFGPHLEVLKGYLLLCAQEWPLAVLGVEDLIQGLVDANLKSYTKTPMRKPY